MNVVKNHFVEKGINDKLHAAKAKMFKLSKYINMFLLINRLNGMFINTTILTLD